MRDNIKKTAEKKKHGINKDINLNEIVERKKLQNKVLKKMIDSINKENK